MIGTGTSLIVAFLAAGMVAASERAASLPTAAAGGRWTGRVSHLRGDQHDLFHALDG